jgi:DNA-binding beta-propeller fold protein YncE
LWGRPEGEQALATAPDGRSLYVVDPMRSLIVEMNTRTLKVVRRARVDLGTLGDGTVSAQIGSDGRTLFVGADRRGAPIVAIDLGTLRVAARWTMPSGVAGFGISEDGARLYAALADQVRVVDPASGRELAELRVPGVDSILHVASPAA